MAYVDDRYEQQHSRPRHHHHWVKDSAQSARCECGARCGVLTAADLSPPGLTADMIRRVLSGQPAVGEAPRLPNNWRK